MSEEYDYQTLSKLSPMVSVGSTDLRPDSYIKAFNEPFDIYVIEYFNKENHEFIWEYFTLKRLLMTYSISHDELDDMIMFSNLDVTNEFITYKSLNFYCCKNFIRFNENCLTVRVIGRSICQQYLIETISAEYLAPCPVARAVVDLHTLVQMQALF